jgi:predicted aspartyl protease
MKYLFGACALLAAPLAHAGSCHLQTVGEINVSADGPTMVADGQVNGQPIRLTIDTGSEMTLLFRDSARKLHLPLRGAGSDESADIGGERRVYSAQVKSFQVGSSQMRNADLVVTGKSLGEAQGVVGEPFLTQTDVEFDLAHGKVRFFRAEGCDGDQVVYWGAAYSVLPLERTNLAELLVRVKVNGAPVLAQLDTGSDISVLTRGGAARAGMSPTSKGMERGGKIQGAGHEKITAYVGDFDSFSFGDETIRHTKLWIADLFHANKEYDPAISAIPVKVVDTPDMLIGADFFKSHRVYVSIQQHKVYASYVGGPVFAVADPAAGADTKTLN